VLRFAYCQENSSLRGVTVESTSCASAASHISPWQNNENPTPEILVTKGFGSLSGTFPTLCDLDQSTTTDLAEAAQVTTGSISLGIGVVKSPFPVVSKVPCQLDPGFSRPAPHVLGRH
jgi:hypothetical protein